MWEKEISYVTARPQRDSVDLANDRSKGPENQSGLSISPRLEVGKWIVKVRIGMGHSVTVYPR